MHKFKQIFTQIASKLALIVMGELRGPIQLEICDGPGKLQRSEFQNIEGVTLIIERCTITGL